MKETKVTMQTVAALYDDYLAAKAAFEQVYGLPPEDWTRWARQRAMAQAHRRFRLAVWQA